MDDYYEDDYESCCPECGHSPTRHRQCTDLYCEDGFVDEHNLDAINNPTEGEEFVMCYECYGTGIEEWCPKCGFDISKHKYYYEKRLIKYLYNESNKFN